MIHNKYYEIMKEFLGDYNRQVYGRGLIGSVSMSPKAISLTLNELEKQKVLISKMRAGAKYFYLNKLNPVIRNYLLIFEVKHSIKFLEKNEKIKHMMNEIIKPGQIICVFGSYAKNRQKKDSDIDLFIVGNYDKERVKEISENYKLKISVKNSSKVDFIKSIKENNLLMKEILLNHIILSGYEEFVSEVIKQKW